MELYWRKMDKSTFNPSAVHIYKIRLKDNREITAMVKDSKLVFDSADMQRIDLDDVTEYAEIGEKF